MGPSPGTTSWISWTWGIRSEPAGYQASTSRPRVFQEVQPEVIFQSQLLDPESFLLVSLAGIFLNSLGGPDNNTSYLLLLYTVH